MARSTCWLLLGASLSSVAVACNSGSGGGGGGGGGGRGMDSGSPTTDGATPVDGATTWG